MEKLSGLVLDVYDDPSGEVLRGIFPTYESVPELVKQAHPLSAEERNQLPDDLFALVLVDEDTVLRKLACADAGNTALSVEYFLKTAHKLPEEAQQRAAENLVKACSWYGIEPPEQLQKIALLNTVMRVGTLASVVPGTRAAVKRGKQQAQASGAFVNPELV